MLFLKNINLGCSLGGDYYDYIFKKREVALLKVTLILYNELCGERNSGLGMFRLTKFK